MSGDAMAPMANVLLVLVLDLAARRIVEVR